MMNETEDFTLVIPTYNRPHYLNKLLHYCVSRFSKIIILDSSNLDNIAKNVELISSLSIKVQHRIYDSKINPTEKLLDGLQNISTPYFAFCADDDIIFKKGVVSALNVLRNCPEYMAVDGIYLNFEIENDNVKVGIEYSKKGIDAEHSMARVFRLLQNYESLFYGVYRIEEFLPIIKTLPKIPSSHFQELFQSVAVVLKGKTYKLPIYYAGRQKCEMADPSLKRWQTYYWFAENRIEFLEHYNEYRNELFEFYKEYVIDLGLESSNFIQLMDLAHASFFSKNCAFDYFNGIANQHFSLDRYSDEETDIIQNMKSPARQYIEKLLEYSTKIINIGIRGFSFPWHLMILNKSMNKKYGYSYKCKLSKRIKWISAEKEFQYAYKELYMYLIG